MIKFMVMKLLTKVEVSAVTGLNEDFELGGCAGYVPVFNTLQEAEEHADHGRFQIATVKMSDEEVGIS